METENRNSSIPRTKRLYWDDDHCLVAEAMITQVLDQAFTTDRSCFYPGGGGQPPDTGFATFGNGETVEITSVHADPNEMIWHDCSRPVFIGAGTKVRLAINAERRFVLARYHTVLHILNTIALRDYDGWITGVQIGVEYSRIDFKLSGFSPKIRIELEEKVNGVLSENRILKSYFVAQEEFSKREDLLRTLEAKPPVIDGCVRVVEIEGFDAQACGGTHVEDTSKIGVFSIFKTENKGKINKRLYVRLT